MESLIRQWDGESAIIRFDRPSGAWIIIAIHSTLLGPATGGTRMKHYPDFATALIDAQGLAAGMTLKFALAGLPRGGAKAVIAVPAGFDPDQRPGLLRRYGRAVADLRGLFQTGPDLGTSSEDMDIIAETGAPHVFSRTRQGGGAGSPGPLTALGVLSGIRAVCEHLFGDPSIRERTVLVQGAGSVGTALVKLLLEEEANVIVCDTVEARARELAGSRGVRQVSAAQAYATPCDIFSPCGVGRILGRETIAQLECRAVAGSANTQLQGPEEAGRLQQRGILYVPDYAINAGGALAITGIETLGWSREEAERRVRDIGETVRRIIRVAEAEGTTTEEAARRIALARLEAAASS